jgi:hypothetical protein
MFNLLKFLILPINSILNLIKLFSNIIFPTEHTYLFINRYTTGILEIEDELTKCASKVSHPGNHNPQTNDSIRGKDKLIHHFMFGGKLQSALTPIFCTLTRGELVILYKIFPFNLRDPGVEQPPIEPRAICRKIRLTALPAALCGSLSQRGEENASSFRIYGVMETRVICQKELCTKLQLGLKTMQIAFSLVG